MTIEEANAIATGFVGTATVRLALAMAGIMNRLRAGELTEGKAAGEIAKAMFTSHSELASNVATVMLEAALLDRMEKANTAAKAANN